MINDVLLFLNENSGALTVIFSALVTISTVVYAVLTGVLVRETRKMREVQTEPRIEITLKPYDTAINFLRLRVRNIGNGPAKNVRFKWEVVSGGRIGEGILEDLAKTNFLNTGLKYFGPNQDLNSHYTRLDEGYEEKLSCVLLYIVFYESISGVRYEDRVIIDMSEFRGLYRFGVPSLYSISKSIEKMQKDFGHVVTGFKRIHADIYTQEDREAKRKEVDAYCAERESKKS